MVDRAVEPERRSSRRQILKAAVVGGAALAVGPVMATRPARAAWDGTGLPPQPWFIRYEMNNIFNCPPPHPVRQLL